MMGSLKMTMGARQTWLLVAVLFLILQQNVDPAAAVLSLDIADLCPYSNFCTATTNRTIDDPGLQSCCLPCSCRSDCGIVGKCCPDAEQSSAIPEEYPCRYQQDVYKSYLKFTQAWKIIQDHAYKIIDGCPTEASNDADLTESVFRCHNAVDLEDLVFVTATASVYTYLNKHCAICNNEDTYTGWTLYLNDRNLLSPGMSFEERDRRILNTGGVESVPPSYGIALKSLCSVSQINSCNVTGRWDFYDRELDMKCNTVTVEYYQDYWAGPCVTKIPADWNIATSDENFEDVELDPNDKAFIEVKDKITKGKLYYSTIERIVRIENRSLWVQYQARKRLLDTLNKGQVQNERELWHGTDKDTAQQIVTGGYNRGYAGKNATLYGCGTYFAVESEFSGRDTYAKPDHNGVRRIILNKVLTGFYTKVGKNDAVLPTRIETAKGKIPFDSAVDDPNNITMFIIFHNCQAYPQYLIEYRSCNMREVCVPKTYSRFSLNPNTPETTNTCSS